MGSRVSLEFYLRPDVVGISRDLLGMYLCTRIDRRPLTVGRIVETEAYGGATDRASHAYANRRTPRTDVMFRRGGVAYVYLCYGMHHLFNLITNEAGIPDAVLVRAVEPVEGVDVMLGRRGRVVVDRSLTGGPGSLSQALGIKVRHSGSSVLGKEIWLEEGLPIMASEIIASPRVGVSYAGADAKRPWRFRVRDNPWTSPAK